MISVNFTGLSNSLTLYRIYNGSGVILGYYLMKPIENKDLFCTGLFCGTFFGLLFVFSCGFYGSGRMVADGPCFERVNILCLSSDMPPNNNQVINYFQRIVSVAFSQIRFG